MQTASNWLLPRIQGVKAYVNLLNFVLIPGKFVVKSIDLLMILCYTQGVSGGGVLVRKYYTAEIEGLA